MRRLLTLACVCVLGCLMAGCNHFAGVCDCEPPCSYCDLYSPHFMPPPPNGNGLTPVAAPFNGPIPAPVKGTLTPIPVMPKEK